MLDRARLRAPLAKACRGKPARSRLPLDPRTLVVKGINRPGAAYQYNAYWIDVRNAAGFRPNPTQAPRTCGEWRARTAAGKRFLETRQTFQLLGTSRAYHDIWKAWGLSSRPADFDRQVRQRYGLFAAKFRNPYPLPGEDPKRTDGGGGQLPLGLIQGRDRDLTYNGRITISCAACHDSQLGTDRDGLGFYHGRANDAFDPVLFAVDLVRTDFQEGRLPHPGVIGGGLLPFPYNAGRGINDAFGLVDLMGVLFDMETLDASPGLELFPFHGAPGQVQTPNWWSRPHRTRMFLGGDLSSDNVHAAMALQVANIDKTGAEKKAVERDFENIKTFLESLSPPPYPKHVDLRLAKRGARLFHTRDLRAARVDGKSPASKPANSCAACHGVYSPRYASDRRFLPDRRLKGIIGRITRREVVGTDPARTNLAAPQFKRAWDTSWWGYDYLNPAWTPDGQGRPGTTLARAANDYAATNARLSGPNVWEKGINGYDTPSMYGVWASAPYFHNGSVPTVWGVLKPSARPAVWQRKLTEPGIGGKNQGFDSSFAAYDFDKLGWRYTEIRCDVAIPQAPRITCNPRGTPLHVLPGLLSDTLGPNIWLADQVPPPFSEDEIRRRMIYNTNDYSLGNGGHDFARHLADDEIRALIEYLKTL